MNYGRGSGPRCPRCSSGLAPMLSSLAGLNWKMVAHGDGAFFTEHCDTVVDGRKLAVSRIISAVYYFHRLPKSFSGGVLRIYPLTGREKSDAFVEVEPLNDTLVFFPSWFPHEVLPVSCPTGQFEDSRFAINCWVYP